MHRNVRRVVDAAAALGLAIEPREFPEGTRTAADAAAVIGVALGQIVKSLCFEVDGQTVLALVSGSNQLDEGRLADAAGLGLGAGDAGRVRRVDADHVRRATGYPIGGVPPLGLATDLPVYVDQDLLQYDVLWAAAGTPHVNFSITPDDLVHFTKGTVAVLAKS
jgi:prolyl-tRNA editing enzyme YbaK/EbsC (Cys-tRNA(Pro) deacylase)